MITHIADRIFDICHHIFHAYLFDPLQKLILMCVAQTICPFYSDVIYFIYLIIMCVMLSLVFITNFMMTSSNGNIFHITGPSCGEFTVPQWIPHTKGQWRRALMFSLICARINSWVNNRDPGDLRCHGAHYDVIVMYHQFFQIQPPSSGCSWPPQLQSIVYCLVNTRSHCSSLGTSSHKFGLLTQPGYVRNDEKS